MNPAWIIFMLGITPYGLFYYMLKASMSSLLFVVLSMVYLVVLRVVSEKLASKYFR